jgi:hypothetical protein
MDLNRDLPSQLRPHVRDGRIFVIVSKFLFLMGY